MTPYLLGLCANRAQEVEQPALGVTATQAAQQRNKTDWCQVRCSACHMIACMGIECNYGNGMYSRYHMILKNGNDILKPMIKGYLEMKCN